MHTVGQHVYGTRWYVRDIFLVVALDRQDPAVLDKMPYSPKIEAFPLRVGALSPRDPH